MIQGWWIDQDELPPTKGMLPVESTWICSWDQKEILCVSLLKTNIEVAYLENFVGNPRFGNRNSEIRRAGTKLLSEHADSFARSLGYKRIACSSLAKYGRTGDYYESLGYMKTVPLIGHIKEI